MLMIVQLPTTLGYPNFPYVNVGSMVNYGWEFGLTHRKNQGDFKYDNPGRSRCNGRSTHGKISERSDAKPGNGGRDYSGVSMSR